MKTLRKLTTLRKSRVRAPRTVRRRDFDISDIALTDREHGSAPEAVFDRSTGPWDRRTSIGALGVGTTDEET